MIDLELIACKNEDPELFHHEGPPYTAAKAICATCPERLDCLAEALENDEHGIWGGTTRRERNKMKNRRVGA